MAIIYKSGIHQGKIHNAWHPPKVTRHAKKKENMTIVRRKINQSNLNQNNTNDKISRQGH